MHNESEPTQYPTFTRRQFLRVATAAGMTLTSIILGGCIEEDMNGNLRKKILPLTPEDTPEALKGSIEKKYGIKLTTFSEEQAKGEILSGFIRGKIAWDIPQLRMLDVFLAILPSHFYGPRQHSIGDSFPLRISLGTLGSYDDRGRLTNYPHRVELNDTRAHPEDPYDFFTHLAHELTHSITPLDPGWDPELEANYHEFSFKHSPWYFQIRSILGKDPIEFEDVEEKINRRIDKEWLEAISAKGGNNRSRNLLYRKVRSYEQLIYGLGGFFGNPEEFLAVMAEQYIQGRNHFLEIYSEFFSQDIANKLYGFCKKEVFREKEYQPREIDRVIQQFILVK